MLAHLTLCPGHACTLDGFTAFASNIVNLAKFCAALLLHYWLDCCQISEVPEPAAGNCMWGCSVAWPSTAHKNPNKGR